MNSAMPRKITVSWEQTLGEKGEGDWGRKVSEEAEVSQSGNSEDFKQQGSSRDGKERIAVKNGGSWPWL